MTLLLDTGPVVAAINRSGKHHARCAALLESAEGPPLVPTTVIVEVCAPQTHNRPEPPALDTDGADGPTPDRAACRAPSWDFNTLYSLEWPPSGRWSPANRRD
jgi:predicted nucleic acid-binding protein